MSKWLNNTKRIWKPEDRKKPCHKLHFCPYGQLVEEYPIHPEFDVLVDDLTELGRQGKLETGFNCHVFGHDCPVFYLAEKIGEEE